jgi:arylsulfatase A-like enzyme
MPANQTVTGLVEFIDIFPTLTELAGIDTPAQTAGMSLAKLVENNCYPAKTSVFMRYHNAEAIRTYQYTLTQWFNANNNMVAEMLYDNKNDPDETVNLALISEYKEVLDDLSQQLATYINTRE